MGLVKTENTFDDSSNNATPITSEQIAVSSEDTFVNRTSLNPEQYPDVFAAMTSYVSGSPVIVEYYKLRTPYINKQTISASFSLERAATRYSYDRIHDFEFKLQDQLEIEIDPETNDMNITGIGVLYSGFKANVGDLFLFKLPNDEIGVFVVNLATPLSVYRGTNYKIEFNLYSLITQDIVDKIDASVVEDLYFDKQKYFSDEAALLSNNSYTQLKELNEFMVDIRQRTFSEFYHSGEKTFLRKDDLYDPFLLMFWTAILSVKDYSSSTPLCQINSLYNSQYEGSIWNAMVTKDLNFLSRMMVSPCRYQTHLWDSNYSSLDNRLLAMLRNNTDEEYDSRITPTSFLRADDTSFDHISYGFSNRLYMALIGQYESGGEVSDVDPFLLQYANDPRFAPELNDEVFAFNLGAYLPLNDFTSESIESTSTNNNIHIPDGEYMIYEWLVYRRVDIDYLLTTIRSAFPFIQLNETDRFYYYALFYFLTKVAVKQLR